MITVRHEWTQAQGTQKPRHAFVDAIRLLPFLDLLEGLLTQHSASSVAHTTLLRPEKQHSWGKKNPKAQKENSDYSYLTISTITTTVLIIIYYNLVILLGHV